MHFLKSVIKIVYMDESQAVTQQKNTNPLLVIGIIVFVVVVAGVFWLTSNQAKNTESAQTMQTEKTATAAPTQPVTESTPDESMAKSIVVEGGNFYFKPNEIKVKKGEKVKITFTSAGGMHNFVIDEFNVASETVNGKSTTVEFTPDKTGTFEFYCSIGSHRQMGMKGNLIVEE